MIDRDGINKNIKGGKGEKEYQREKIEKIVEIGKGNKSPNKKGQKVQKEKEKEIQIEIKVQIEYGKSR